MLTHVQLGRLRGRVHRTSVCLSEHPAVVFVRISEFKYLLRLLCFELFEHRYAVRWDDNLSRLAGLGGLAPDFTVVCDLVVRATDGEVACREIKIAPFESDYLSSATACRER